MALFEAIGDAFEGAVDFADAIFGFSGSSGEQRVTFCRPAIASSAARWARTRVLSAWAMPSTRPLPLAISSTLVSAAAR